MTTDTGKIVVPGAVGLEEMSYEQHVERGRQLMGVVESCARELGDHALQVETSYGENTLEKYAAEIGFRYQSLKRLQAGLRRVPTGKGGPVHQFMVCAPRARRARSPSAGRIEPMTSI